MAETGVDASAPWDTARAESAANAALADNIDATAGTETIAITITTYIKDQFLVHIPTFLLLVLVVLNVKPKFALQMVRLQFRSLSSMCPAKIFQ